MTSSNKSVSKKKRFRWLRRLPLRLIGGTFGLIAIILAGAQLVLSPRYCTQIINKYAPLFIDGDFKMSSAHINVLRNFPRLTAQIDSLSLTYPYPLDSSRTDTLASFTSFTLSMNPLDLFLKGKLNVRTLVLEHARVKLEYYDDSTSNLQIIKPLQGDKQKPAKDADSSSFKLPEISIRRLALDESAHIDYIKKKDTLSVDVDKLNIHSHDDNLHIITDARTYLATESLGNVTVPFSIDGSVYTTSDPNGAINVTLDDFAVKVAQIDFHTDMNVVLGDNIGLKGTVCVPQFNVQDVIDGYLENIIPETGKISTDARIAVNLDVDGHYDYDTGALPSFNLDLDIPRCKVSHADYDIVPQLELKAAASAPQGGSVQVQVSTLDLCAQGLDAKVRCTLDDLLGEDPLVSAKASVNAVLDTLDNYLLDRSKMRAGGRLNASLNGKFRFSNLDIYNLSGAEVDADVFVNDLTFRSFQDSLDVYVDSLGVKAGMEDVRFKDKSGKNRRLVYVRAGIDSLNLEYKDDTRITGRKIVATLKSSPNFVKLSDSVKYNPVALQLALGSIYLKGQDSLAVRLKDSHNSFSVFPSFNDKRLPVVHLTSMNKSARVATGPHHLGFKDVNLFARAEMNKPREHQRKIPGTRRVNSSKKPDYLQDEDFKKADIKIDLGSAFTKFFKSWNVSGKAGIERTFIKTQVFPLRTSVSSLQCSFSNDCVSLDSLRIRSGVSRIRASGSISNLRRVLSRNGTLNMDFKLSTDTLSVNQLLEAYSRGRKNMEQNPSFEADVDSSDEAVNQMDTAAVVEDIPEDVLADLIILPANVDARVDLDLKNVTYSDMELNSLLAKVVMNKRCLQLIGANADTSVGEISLDAFYSTKTRDNLLCGFDLNLNNINAGQVIHLMPMIDTLMPVLKSFDGLLNCTLAATAPLDEHMNLKLPQLDGVIRISGKNLHFNENREIKKIASMLMFKQPSRVAIDTMRVEGILKDNILEIFPFILTMDRWQLALAGLQNLDKSFRYHISFIKSPLIFKFGVNIYGPDFDNLKLKLGKAQYLNSSVPSFSQAIDDTRINLRTSINNIFQQSIERAMEQNEKMEAIRRQRQKLGYQRSVVEAAMQEQ